MNKPAATLKSKIEVLAAMTVVSTTLASVVLLLPMIGSRFNPFGAGLLGEGAWFFVAMILQSFIFFAMAVFLVFDSLFERWWATSSWLFLIAPVGILLLAGGDFVLFPELLALAGSLALVAVVASMGGQPVVQRKVVAMQGPQTRQQPESDDDSEEDVINFPAERSDKTFANVVGMDALKARLLEAGKEIIGSQSAQGAQRNGILLFGEPGNGKTFFAEALAGELKLPMITATFGDVSSRYINQTTEQVMAVFRSAHAQAPCVLFLDEIDSLIKDRNLSMGSNDEAAKTTNAILTELVNARKSRIVVVAATNFLEKLDQAAIREGLNRSN